MYAGVTFLSKLSELTAVHPLHGTEVGFMFVVFLFLTFIACRVVMESRHHNVIIGTLAARPAE